MNPYSTYKPSGIDWIGDIPSHWEVKKLKFTVTKVGSGVTPSGGAAVYQTEGVPLLRSQNIHFDGLRLNDVAYISKEVDASMSNSRVLAGDVLLNITGGSIGRCYFMSENFGPANVNQHVCIVRPAHEQVNTKFLYRLLSSPIGQTQIDLLQTGANREGLNFEQLKNFDLSLPPLSEQAAIASYLDEKTAQLDTFIDRKRRLIDLLREEKTALINEAVTKGINPDVPMKDSGIEWLGRIPEHWEVNQLKHVAKKLTDGEHISPNFQSEGMPFLSAKDVGTRGVNIEVTKFVKFEDGVKFRKRCDPEYGDLLVVSRGATIGRTALVDTMEKFCLLGSVILIKPNQQKIINLFLYYFLSNSKVEETLLLTSDSSAQQAIYLINIANLHVPLPSLYEQTDIVAYLDAETAKIDHTISRIEREIELMQEYRTALIGEVVTGKVKVV